MVDVGCGHGHWGQRLLPLLHPDATLHGIDQEQEWVRRARTRAVSLGLGDRCTYEVGDALSLPFDDKRFDLVTCQTLVMHVGDPATVIGEMLRILAPGGRILLAEPSNLPNQFSSDTVQRAMTPEQVADIAHFFVACSRGRSRLGRGDDCVADVVPEILLDAGLQRIEAFQNDRCNSVLPPYSEQQRAQLDEEIGHAKRGFWLWDEQDARVLFEAGGADAARFDALYKTFVLRGQLLEAQVKAETYTRTGGASHYLLTAVLPGQG